MGISREPLIAGPLAAYLAQGMHQVEGWLAPTSAAIIAYLGLTQTAAGLRGDVCEIGVHHGKLFLMLANLIAENEAAYAVDVFSDQHKNIDKSGCGNRAVFEAHLRAYAPQAPVNIIQESSLDLDGSDFGNLEFRLFSIDGGHTAKITEHDLRLAQSCILPGGIVIADDILSPHWLGVVTGVARFLARDAHLVPFAVSSNKLYFTTDTKSAEKYRDGLRKTFPLALEKTDIEFFDGAVDCYGEHPSYNRFETDSPVFDTSPQHEGLPESSATHAAELANLQTKIDAILSSTSWRITTPGRKLAALFKGRN